MIPAASLAFVWNVTGGCGGIGTSVLHASRVLQLTAKMAILYKKSTANTSHGWQMQPGVAHVRSKNYKHNYTVELGYGKTCK